MGLQARMSADDQRLYNPGRDVAHCFVKVVTEVARRLEDGCWPPLDAYLKDAGMGDEEVGLACQKFVEFVITSQDSRETMFEALTRVGWFDVPERAQVAYMAYLGQVLTGIFFLGVHEANFQGFQSPLVDADMLAAAGHQVSKLLQLPKWKRPFYRFWAKVCRVLQAFKK